MALGDSTRGKGWRGTSIKKHTFDYVWVNSGNLCSLNPYEVQDSIENVPIQSSSGHYILGLMLQLLALLQFRPCLKLSVPTVILQT